MFAISKQSAMAFFADRDFSPNLRVEDLQIQSFTLFHYKPQNIGDMSTLSEDNLHVTTCHNFGWVFANVYLSVHPPIQSIVPSIHPSIFPSIGSKYHTFLQLPIEKTPYGYPGSPRPNKEWPCRMIQIKDSPLPMGQVCFLDTLWIM